MCIGSTLWNTQLRGRWDMQTTRTGPNDSPNVVWALGVWFFFYLWFFILINVLFYVFRFYSTKYATEREMGCADDENGLEQRIQRRLATVWEQRMKSNEISVYLVNKLGSLDMNLCFCGTNLLPDICKFSMKYLLNKKCIKDITSTGIILVFVEYFCQFLFNLNEKRIIGFTLKMQIQWYINL